VWKGRLEGCCFVGLFERGLSRKWEIEREGGTIYSLGVLTLQSTR